MAVEIVEGPEGCEEMDLYLPLCVSCEIRLRDVIPLPIRMDALTEGVQIEEEEDVLDGYHQYTERDWWADEWE